MPHFVRLGTSGTPSPTKNQLVLLKRDVSTSFLGVLRKDAIRNDIEEIGCSLALRLPVYN